MQISKYKELLLSIARMAILEELEGKRLIDKQALYEKYPFLKEKAAVFVTLNKRVQEDKPALLRGCIGSIMPYRSLLEDIIHNAKAAAFHDYRFPPLSREEFDDIELEISILSIPQRLEYDGYDDLKSKIKPFEHGVILEKNGHRATFLPAVWEKLPDFDIFFEHLCIKAGLERDCIKDNVDIKVYTVTEISE